MLLVLMAACAHHDLRALPADAFVPPSGEPRAHDEAQTEWWHVHADLADVETGETVHVFAAFLVERTDRDDVLGLPVAWGVNPFHTAFVRIQTDEGGWSADRHNFPDLFAARFAHTQSQVDLRHGDWRLSWELGALVLSVGAGPHRLDLRLVPTGPATRPGKEGLVELVAGSRHLWSQHEGMRVDGQWRHNGELHWVEGTGFHKHQWGRLYDDELDGFQWISMDLPSGGGLSIAWLTDDGMHGVPGSLAWVSQANGSTVPVPVRQLRVTPTRTWKSRRSGASWPVAWQIEGPGIELTVEALADNQEIWAFPAPIYAGPAQARGEVLGEPIDSLAFVEQVGQRVPRLRALLRSSPPPQRAVLTASNQEQP